MRRARIGWWLAALAALVWLAACQWGAPPPPQAPSWSPRRVAVLPYRTVRPDPGGTTACSPVTGAIYACGIDTAAAPEARRVLDRALMEILDQRAAFQVVPPAQAAPVYQRLRRERLGLSVRRAVAAAGRRLGVDAVLVGHIYRYRQRVGGPYTAQRPASVAFDLNLVRVADASVVWKNSFDQTQRSLSENILNLEQYVEHGLRWLTARELARLGMRRLMAGFPWLKPPAEHFEE